LVVGLILLIAGEYIEAPDMSAAIAAACLAAAALGASPPDPDVGAWLTASGIGARADLADQATRVFSRAAIPEDNEWYELWSDAGRLNDVPAALVPYRRYRG
jgi:hypothetical protein